MAPAPAVDKWGARDGCSVFRDERLSKLPPGAQQASFDARVSNFSSLYKYKEANGPEKC